MGALGNGKKMEAKVPWGAQKMVFNPVGWPEGNINVPEKKMARVWAHREGKKKVGSPFFYCSLQKCYKRVSEKKQGPETSSNLPGRGKHNEEKRKVKLKRVCPKKLPLTLKLLGNNN